MAGAILFHVLIDGFFFFMFCRRMGNVQVHCGQQAQYCTLDLWETDVALTCQGFAGLTPNTNEDAIVFARGETCSPSVSECLQRVACKSISELSQTDVFQERLRVFSKIVRRCHAHECPKAAQNNSIYSILQKCPRKIVFKFKWCWKL